MAKITTLSAQDYAQCPIRNVLDRVGNKWSLLVLLNLEDGERRFNELGRAIGDISQRMLTERCAVWSATAIRRARRAQ